MSRFGHVAYDERAQSTQKQFKDAFECMEAMMDTLPEGRAKSLAYTKLEEAYMWVGKAIRDEQVAREKAYTG
jgi:hypothetical protein